jgi:hypothetical protein
MRERYGFTANESLDMAYEEFDKWLEALLDDGEERASEDPEETWEAVTDGQQAGQR